MTAHNSFDLNQIDGKFLAVSHNFSDIKAEGATEREAIDNLNRAIINYKDNNQLAFTANIKERLKNGVQCGCGLKLEEPCLKIYKGRK